jgi:hypothetical protein
MKRPVEQQKKNKDNPQFFLRKKTKHEDGTKERTYGRETSVEFLFHVVRTLSSFLLRISKEKTTLLNRKYCLKKNTKREMMEAEQSLAGIRKGSLGNLFIFFESLG